MVSKTRKTKRVRKNKARSAGQKRKNALNNSGTTPTAEELFKVQKEG